MVKQLEEKATGKVVEGYVHDNHHNWVVDGEKKPFGDYRELLPNGIPVNCLALVKYSDKEHIVGITGYDAISSTYEARVVAHHAKISVLLKDIIQVIDRDFYLDSPVWKVAEFYRIYKEKSKLICPNCKERFHYISLECRNCRGVSSFTNDVKFECIELTDEIVQKHNDDVFIRNYTKDFERESRYEEYKKYGYTKNLSMNSLENVEYYGKDLSQYRTIVSEEALEHLRKVYVRCYNFTLNELKKEFKNYGS